MGGLRPQCDSPTIEFHWGPTPWGQDQLSYGTLVEGGTAGKSCTMQGRGDVDQFAFCIMFGQGVDDLFVFCTMTGHRGDQFAFCTMSGQNLMVAEFARTMGCPGQDLHLCGRLHHDRELRRRSGQADHTRHGATVPSKRAAV